MPLPRVRRGAAPGTAFLHFDGSAGQSFGAFLTAGVTLELVGEANDYVGKGMGGGTVVVRPPVDDASLAAGADALRGHRPALAGNTCLYGATGGELFVAGIVGERFAIRNSGATTVVEGAGDHACEYMTGGTVVILGRVGYNLGAGMTGGSCYVWDPSGTMIGRVNPSLVDFERPDEAHGEELRELVTRHARLTASPRRRPAGQLGPDGAPVLVRGPGRQGEAHAQPGRRGYRRQRLDHRGYVASVASYPPPPPQGYGPPPGQYGPSRSTNGKAIAP